MSIKIGLSFVLGAAVGSGTTFYFLKSYFEKREEENVQSVKDTLEQIYKKEVDEKKEEIDEVFEEPEFVMDETENVDAIEYAKILAKNRYASKNEDTEKKERPYVISPKDFGEYEEYTKISLLYTADSVLLDENYEPIENPNSSVGLASLEHFGEYEDDAVHVRNDRLKADYEILVDPRTYDEIRKEYR